VGPIGHQKKGTDSCLFTLIGRRSDQDLSRPRTVKLAEENGLPRPENGPALFNEDGLRRPEKGGFDVGGGVSLRMPVTVGERDDPVQDGKDVSLNIRVGILIDRDRRGRVGHKEMADAVFDPRFPDCRRDTLRDVDHLAPGRRPDGQ